MITINIKEGIWEYLNKQKKPGETFNEVLIRILKIKGVSHEVETSAA